MPFAYADFHARIFDGRPVAIGCPKLDDCQAYVQKLSQIIHVAQIRSITVVHMEVPCCTGLLRIAQAGRAARRVRRSRSTVSIVGVRGQLLTQLPHHAVTSTSTDHAARTVQAIVTAVSSSDK